MPKRAAPDKGKDDNAKKGKHREQAFLPEYSKTWPEFTASAKGRQWCKCTVCDNHFLVSHGGRDDCRRHADGPIHKKNKGDKESNQKLDGFFGKASASEKLADAVIKAETLFVSFVVEHNLAMQIADHATKLFPIMFPDSQIAKAFACGRTKASCIVDVLAEDTVETSVAKMKEAPFSISTDGSNDGEEKYFPIITRIINNGMIQSVLLGNPTCHGGATGENIFKLLDSAMEQHDLDWRLCISFGSDNANVMTGNKKGVISLIREENPAVQLIGCPCHLIHLAAEHAANVLPCKVADLLTDIYYYLEKSSNRLESLGEMQTFCGVEQHKILKHVPTRWLSLGQCINRLIEQWIPLRRFFYNECNGSTAANDRKSRALEKLQSSQMKLYCLFLHSVIPIFNKANLLLQEEKPMIHKLFTVLKDLLKQIMLRFIKPSVIATTDLLKVKLDLLHNQKSNGDLFIGQEARDYIKNSKGLTEQKIAAFYKNVREYYVTACTYMVKKFPFTDELFLHARAADISQRSQIPFAAVEFFLDKFRAIEDTVCDIPRDELQQEYMNYQVESFSPDLMSKDRADEQWIEVGRLMDCCGAVKYKVLPKVMACILLIPHSNCDCERLFSAVRKNKTDLRKSMKSSKLQSLLQVKQNVLDPCYERRFSNELLRKAKSATYQALQKQKDT